MGNKGFTLIELTVTISILCIVVALAVLVIDTDMFYMEKMADEFVMDVRYVQKECMKSTTGTHKIGIDIDNGCYYIYNNSVVEKTVVFKNRYHIDYSNKNMKSVGFTFEGIPINAGTFKIMDSQTNKIKEISIVPATGRTVIKE
jgi:prepilin-type N-terminal cleavage/methylation domain-containing protein